MACFFLDEEEKGKKQCIELTKKTVKSKFKPYFVINIIDFKYFLLTIIVYWLSQFFSKNKKARAKIALAFPNFY